jgi:hypothetical protein
VVPEVTLPVIPVIGKPSTSWLSTRLNTRTAEEEAGAALVGVAVGVAVAVVAGGEETCTVTESDEVCPPAPEQVSV